MIAVLVVTVLAVLEAVLKILMIGLFLLYLYSYGIVYWKYFLNIYLELQIKGMPKKKIFETFDLKMLWNKEITNKNIKVLILRLNFLLLLYFLWIFLNLEFNSIPFDSVHFILFYSNYICIRYFSRKILYYFIAKYFLSSKILILYIIFWKCLLIFELI